MYASAQALDFLAGAKNPSFQRRKLDVSYKVKFSYVYPGFRIETSQLVSARIFCPKRVLFRPRGGGAASQDFDPIPGLVMARGGTPSG